MAGDLIESVSRLLTPELVGGFARAFGINEAVAAKLFNAAAPTILAAFATTAAAPGGARKISEAVSGSDPDLLTKLAASLGGGDAGPLADGANLLRGLLGGSGLANVAGALAQASGAPPAAAQSATGAAVQAVIGAIGQEDPSVWSDGPAIAAFLESQKAAISAALPPDIAKALSPTGLVAGLGDIGAAAAAKASAAAAAAKASAAAAGAAAASRAPVPPRSSAFPTWAAILIVVIVLAAIWAFVVEKRKNEPSRQGMAPAPVEVALDRPAQAASPLARDGATARESRAGS